MRAMILSWSLLSFVILILAGCEKYDLPRKNPQDIASFRNRFIHWSCDSLSQGDYYGDWNVGAGSKSVKGLGFWNDVDFDSTLISLEYYSPFEHTISCFFGYDNPPKIMVDDTLRQFFPSEKGDSIYSTPMESVLYYTFSFKETEIIPAGHHQLRFVFEADAVTGHENYLDEISIWIK